MNVIPEASSATLSVRRGVKDGTRAVQLSKEPRLPRRDPFKGTELPDFSSTWAGRTRCCLNPLPPLNCITRCLTHRLPPPPSHWELQAGDQPDLPLPHAPGQATPSPRALG